MLVFRFFTSVNLKIKYYLDTAAIFYPNWDREYARQLLEEFKLDPKKRISQLSKGQASMVSILIAVASRADITILDEPVAGLDVVIRERFYRMLLDDFTETGRTFIISTHIIEEAASVFERVIILDEGKIIENISASLGKDHRKLFGDLLPGQQPGREKEIAFLGKGQLTPHTGKGDQPTTIIL